MSQANRKYGKSLATCTVAGLDIRPIVTDISPSPTYTTVDGTCLVDTENTNIANRRDYRIRITVAVDSDYDTTLAAIFAAAGTSVDFVILPYAAATWQYGVSGTTGKGLLTTWDGPIPDGAQTVSFELIPDGSGGLGA